MNAPKQFVRIVDGKRYNVSTATLLADDCYFDGYNRERDFHNTFLYRTPGQAFFKVTLTLWQSERDLLTPIDRDEAISLYETDLTEHHVEYEDAFPGGVVEEA